MIDRFWVTYMSSSILWILAGIAAYAGLLVFFRIRRRKRGLLPAEKHPQEKPADVIKLDRYRDNSKHQ